MDFALATVKNEAIDEFDEEQSHLHPAVILERLTDEEHLNLQSSVVTKRLTLPRSIHHHFIYFFCLLPANTAESMKFGVGTLPNPI